MFQILTDKIHDCTVCSLDRSSWCCRALWLAKHDFTVRSEILIDIILFTTPNHLNLRGR